MTFSKQGVEVADIFDAAIGTYVQYVLLRPAKQPGRMAHSHFVDQLRRLFSQPTPGFAHDVFLGPSGCMSQGRGAETEESLPFDSD